MNRYRLNIRFLIILMAIAIAGCVGVYLAWSFQVKRNAGSLLARAEQAAASDDLPEAARLYLSYLNIIPDGEESNTVRAKLSLALLDLASRPDRSPEDVGNALGVVPANIRQIPDNDEVRAAFVKFAMSPRVSRWTDADRHLQTLIEHQPDNTDFKTDRLQCLIRTGSIERDDGAIAYGYKLIGYDEPSGTFKPETAKAGDCPRAYSLLAPLVRRYRRDEKLADRIIDQMIAVNPEMGEAYLERSRYASSLGRREQAREDIAKAYELDPKNADILVLSAQYALNDRDLEKARQFLKEGIEVDPADVRFYDWSARVEAQSGELDAAFARIEEGIKAADQPQPLYLLKAQLDMSIGADAVRATKERMRKMGFVPFFIDYVEGQALIAEKKWVDAVGVFERVQESPLGTDSSYGPMINTYLGLCNYSLGRWDKALRAYQLALEMQPDNEQAKGAVQLLQQRFRPKATSRTQSINDIIAEVKALPEEERDWNKVNEFVEAEIAKWKETAESGGKEFDETLAQLYRAEVLIARGEFEEARELIRGCDTGDIRVRRAAINLTARDPAHGPADALKLLAKTVDRFGDSPQLRQDKAVYLIQLGGDDLADRIAELTQGMDDWKPSDQVQIWQLAAQAYAQLRLPQRAQECLQRVLELAPQDLATRVGVFEMARARFDDEAMLAAEEEILKVVGRKDDSTYQFAEAARLVALFQAGKRDRAVLDTAGALVAEALKERPEWHKLHLLRAEIALANGRLTEALNAYDRAAQLGVGSANDIKQHARLLYARGRVQDARRVIETIPKAVRQQAFPQLSAEIMFNGGNVAEALETADLLITAQPNDPSLRLWYGSLLQRASKLEEEETRIAKAGEMYRAAVDLGPSRYDTWTTWINYLGSTGRMEDAEQAIREAQLALPAGALPIAMAKYSEMLGRWRDAEAYYRAAIHTDPTNIRGVRILAEFFLNPSNPLPDKTAKAFPYLNQIVRAGHDGQIASNNDDLIWARQRIAVLLASSKDYQQLLKAEKSIEANAIDGELQVADKLQLAQILSTRPEPESRKKAIQLLEDVVQAGHTLNAEGGVMLAKLYRQIGDWPMARRRMLDTIGQHGNDPVVMAAFTEMLIAREDFRDAETRLKQLREVQPDHPSILPYTIQILAGQGKKGEAVRLLLGFVEREGGRNLADLTAADLPLLEQVAKMLVQIDAAPEAETLLREHYRISQAADQAAAEAGGNASYTARSALLLADHLGRFGDTEEAMKLLKSMWENTKSTGVIGVALSVVRARREELGTTADDLIDGWLEDALRREPDSVTLQMQLADFRDVQKKFGEAETIYRRLLSRRDIGPRQRGIVLNNIAFLLALQETDLGSALQYAEEGRNLFGPTSDMLDTMAVVRIARKDAEGAIKDLELAIADNPTAAKYFHLTRAYLLAEENRKALQAWDQAIDLGLGLDALNLLEHDEYRRIESQIQEIRRDRNRA